MSVFTVSQVTHYLKESMEADSLLRDLWVFGEVSNLSPSAAGHYYFTLKDATGQLRCAMFRPARGAERLANGGAINAHGRISIYEVRGELQLYVDLVQPEGLGEKHLELERLKVKLEAEGLFLEARKRALPAFPKRIGVVTSPTGSVWHDIQNIVRRRFPLVELALAPTSVQGATAAAAIVEAFQTLNMEEDIDVVILARGGGSLEDLWPFNEESVARAIYSSRAPVVSAIGHETDYTVADLVADLRAPTPSAAAELVVPDQDELKERLAAYRRDLFQWTSGELEQRAREVEQAAWRLGRRAPDVPSWRQRVDDLSHASLRALRSHLSLEGERTQALSMRLASLDPKSVLARGYAVLQGRASGQTVTSVAQVSEGDEITVTVSDGSFPTRVLPDGSQLDLGGER